MEEFCSALGERVSFNKSSIFFSPNVDAELKAKIKGIAGMKISNEIGIYLGFPLATNKREDSDTYLTGLNLNFPLGKQAPFL